MSGQVYLPEKPWTTMNRHFLDDPQLSPKAKGLLAYILSRPPEWDYSVNGLSACHPTGEKSIRAGIRELEDGGYLRRVQGRSEDGEFGACDWYAAGCPLEEVDEERFTACLFSACRKPARPKGRTSNIPKEVNVQTPSESSLTEGHRRPRRVLPDDWCPHEKHMKKAREYGVDYEWEAEKFKSFHASKDNRYADWDQAFYTWLRNAKEFKQPTQSRTTPPLRRATWND